MQNQENKDNKDEGNNVSLLPATVSAEPSIEKIAQYQHQKEQGSLKEDYVHTEDLKERIKDKEELLQREERDKNINREAAKSKRKAAVCELGFACLIWFIVVGVVNSGLAPTFYGREILALFLAIGAGTLGAWAAHFVLKYLRRILAQKDFDIFVGVVTSAMLVLIIWGATWIYKSQCLQTQMSRQADSRLSYGESSPANSGKDTKEKIDFYNHTGLVLLFLGGEWISGLLLFHGLKKLKRCGTLVRLEREKRRDVEKLGEIRRRIFGKKEKTLEDHILEVKMSKENEASRRSRKIRNILLAVLIGGILFLLFFSDKVFGAETECCFTLIARDISGSHEPHSAEADRAVIGIIESMKPGDEGLVMNIHEQTFSNPALVIRFKMPAKDRVGYWGEELKAAKSRAINEYLRKSADIPRNRRWTELPEGIYLFGKILKEQPYKKKNLILLTDLRCSMPDLNEKMIAEKGEQILSRMKASGLVADLQGADVYVMGFTPAGLTINEFKALETFWRGFFQISGCNLRAMDVTYDRKIE